MAGTPRHPCPECRKTNRKQYDRCHNDPSVIVRAHYVRSCEKYKAWQMAPQILAQQMQDSEQP